LDKAGIQNDAADLVLLEREVEDDVYGV